MGRKLEQEEIINELAILEHEVEEIVNTQHNMIYILEHWVDTLSKINGRTRTLKDDINTLALGINEEEDMIKIKDL